MEAVLDIAFVSVLFVSIFSNFFGLPGNTMIALSSLFYGIATDFESFTFSFVLTIFALVLAIELLEFLLISFTARKYGSSKWGISGAIAGGILGAVSGAFVTPFMGAILGSVLGVFAGAFILEFIKSRQVRQSLLSGFGAFLGKLGGLSVKVIGAVSLGILLVSKIV